jgi:RHS repeat-associated protein
VKAAASPTIYPNQYYTDFGGGAGNQFKHIFIGSERILTKKARVAPDRQHWYYHADHLGSTAMVTNENSQLVDAVHYFPFGEVWLEERPSSLPEEYFFTAKELDPETGFYDFGARYLDPRFSKWLTADPALEKYLPSVGKTVEYESPALANRWRGHPDLPGMGGMLQPKNMALYGYAHLNPATLVDLDGLETLAENAARLAQCTASCTVEQFGIRDLVGGSMVVLGQPNIGKPWAAPGASEGTSIASKYLSKALPWRLPFGVPAPTTANLFAKSAVAGRILGRWVPFVGWGLLAYDGAKISYCTYTCMTKVDEGSSPDHAPLGRFLQVRAAHAHRRPVRAGPVCRNS